MQMPQLSQAGEKNGFYDVVVVCLFTDMAINHKFFRPAIPMILK